MQQRDFRTTTHAKCILIGEHSVIRGSPALVAPVTAKTLSLEYMVDSTSSIEVASPDPAIIRESLTKVLEKAMQITGQDINRFHGKFKLINSIDVAGGLGFSAALCVAVTQWLAWNKLIPADSIFDTARELENLFHGKSSGIDIVGTLNNHLTYFKYPNIISRVNPNWKPKLYISYSGSPKNTKDAVTKISKLQVELPHIADAIDLKMKESVLNFLKGLELNSREGLELLASAIESSCQCFKDWQLITDPLRAHMEQLHSLGCIASKPTGAGGGGYVLSLWQTDPPKTNLELLPIAKDF